MFKKLLKNLSVFIFLISFTAGMFFINQCYSINAATNSKSTSSIASKSSEVKSSNSKSASSKSQGNSKNSSKGNSNQSDSLLSTDGNNLPPAANQNWDQIMSDINNTADKDEFTFSKEPSHLGFFGSKLSYIGFGLILLSILGFTYFFYSSFFSKKSPRKLKKLATSSINSGKNLSLNKNNNYHSNRQTQPRRNPQDNKSIYSDGYGYTRNSSSTRPVKKNTTNNDNKKQNINVQKPKVQSNNTKLKSNTHNLPKAKHMIDDDSNILMSNDNSVKNINTKHSKIKNNSKRNNKKDEFWNDFFLN